MLYTNIPLLQHYQLKLLASLTISCQLHEMFVGNLGCLNKLNISVSIARRLAWTLPEFWVFKGQGTTFRLTDKI